MGDPGAERAAPTELEEITSRISDLSKWREIFSFRGLEINSTTHQPGHSSAGHGEPGAGESPGSQPLLLPQGGRPISQDTAMRLQQLLFRNNTPRFGCEWAAANFSFHLPHSHLAYALQAGKGGTRAILAAVQAHIITYLLFTRDTECTHLERLCRVGRWEQRQALATALAETLWAAGGGGRAAVCLVTAPVTTVPREGCRASSFTERFLSPSRHPHGAHGQQIQLFEFSEKAAAQGFISDHINSFEGEGSHGVILFLYSLLFSRTLERYFLLFKHFPVVWLHLKRLFLSSRLCWAGREVHSGNVTCTEAVLSLLLTGRASPRGLGGHREPEPGAGRGDVPGQRGPVGFLRWERAPGQRQVSPALRSPRVPVWLCSLSGRHAVLFGTDRRLLSDWKSERIFHLYFCSGQQEQTRTAHLTVDFFGHLFFISSSDTHSHHWEEAPREGPCSPGQRCPALEMAIRTRWAGATVSWNGTEPFF
ncbi:inactive ubiquitin carboxyl-terminal hydrolase MINDY-4B [Acridotheres tristis]